MSNFKWNFLTPFILRILLFFQNKILKLRSINFLFRMKVSAEGAKKPIGLKIVRDERRWHKAAHSIKITLKIQN